MVEKLIIFVVLNILINCSLILLQEKDNKAKEEQSIQKTKEEIDAWQKYATPSKEHELIAKVVGKWDAEVKMWSNIIREHL